MISELLVADGWRVLARNWRGGGGELDLVVLRDRAMRMVEVKLREPGDPVGLECVGEGKRRRLVSAASAFLYELPAAAPVTHAAYDEVCFLVALVQGETVTWVDDAFDAG